MKKAEFNKEADLFWESISKMVVTSQIIRVEKKPVEYRIPADVFMQAVIDSGTFIGLARKMAADQDVEAN